MTQTSDTGHQRVTSRPNRSFPKLAAIGLIALSCALAGCGRKAGLDLPPGTVADPSNTPNMRSDTSNPNSATNLQSEVARVPGTSIAVAPRGEKKHITRDEILD